MGGGSRSKRIIAVFGGSKDRSVLTLAIDVGRAIAGANQIVLTGGRYPQKTNKVKNAALNGAHPSPWIGIDRKEEPGVEVVSVDAPGFAIRSDLDHKRNYLEACLSDAVIALDGGDGTVSEVTSSLTLQRPVAFVGDTWKREYDLDADRSGALDKLMKATFRRFDASRGGNALDSVLTKEAFGRDLQNLPRYEYFPSTATADGIVAWIMSAVPDGAALPAAFPLVAGHDTAATAFATWLAEHGA